MEKDINPILNEVGSSKYYDTLKRLNGLAIQLPGKMGEEMLDLLDILWEMQT